MKRSDKIKIGAVYFFLIAGGVWHVLDVFQYLMSALAGPLLIGLAIWLSLEYCALLSNDSRNSKMKFLIWTIIVVIISFAAESIGVKTGKIFGAYEYGETLWPQIFDVPVSIGFAWLLMLLSSTAVMQRITFIRNSNIVIKIVVIAILMTFFDFMMEPAAIKLGYWSWTEIDVPLQNYSAWFILSLLLAAIGSRLDLLKTRQPMLAFHVYFAQMVYFILIWFK